MINEYCELNMNFNKYFFFIQIIKKLIKWLKALTNISFLFNIQFFFIYFGILYRLLKNVSTFEISENQKAIFQPSATPQTACNL